MKAFAIRIGPDDATYFLDGHDNPSMFAPGALDKTVGTEITLDGTTVKVLDAVVLQGGYAAELMVEVVDEGCADCP